MFVVMQHIYVFHIDSKRFRKLIGLKLGTRKIFLRNSVWKKSEYIDSGCMSTNAKLSS
jgi:hypothetical protein